MSYPDGVARRVVADLDTYGSALSLSGDGQPLLATQAQRITNVWVAPAGALAQAKQVTFTAIGRRDGWENLDWTPEGKLLYGAIVRDNLTIWTMSLDGSNQRQVTSAGYRDTNLSTTEDGRYMVFASNRGGSSDIWRARLDGQDMKQLTFGGGNREPHVSPDGRWIVYTSSRGGPGTLWRINVEGGEPVRLARLTGFLATHLTRRKVYRVQIPCPGRSTERSTRYYPNFRRAACKAIRRATVGKLPLRDTLDARR